MMEKCLEIYEKQQHQEMHGFSHFIATFDS